MRTQQQRGLPGRGLRYLSIARPRTVQRRTVTTGGSHHENAPSAPPVPQNTGKDPSLSRSAPANGGKGPNSRNPRQGHAVAHDFYSRVAPP
jgi:hypothetical protein